MSSAHADFEMHLPRQVALHAQHRADDPAFIEDERSITWAELDRRATAIARALVQLGVRKGDRVALLYGCEIEAFELIFGVFKSGAAYAPISPLLTSDMIVTLLEDCTPKAFFSSAQFSPLAAQAAASKDMTVISGGPDLDAFIAGADPMTLLPEIGGDDLANIIYSSGTTGTPKGITHSHRARWAAVNSLAVAQSMTSSSRAYLAIPPHSNGSGIAWGPAALVGARTILHPRFSIDRLFEIFERHRPTHTFMIPLFCQMLLAHPRAQEVDFTCLECAVLSGAPTPEAVKRAMIELTDGGMAELWGLTEGLFTFLGPEELPDRLHAVGRPAVGCELRILDADGGEAAPGETGEIIGRSTGLMGGYWNRPDADGAARWVSPEGDVFFRTGDMGVLDTDGYLSIRGREKDMLISGGFNVYPGDIEAELVKHDDVVDAAVIGVADEKWGETAVGFVVLAQDAAAGADDLASWLNERVAKHQRVREVVPYVGDFPRNTLGKILKDDLRNRYDDRTAG